MEIQTMPSSQGQAATSVPSPKLHKGIDLLWQAHTYATDLQRDAWDFAVEISTLKSAGLTNNDLRWLVCRGWAEHAREITMPGQNGREFRPNGDLTFSKRTCFVLTAAGAGAAPDICRNAEEPGTPTAEPEQQEQPLDDVPPPAKPRWDQELQELRVGEKVVKAFKLPSPNQETILTAFEEEGWPVRIDDPLPPVFDIEPKRRLHDTIKSLNRHQKNRLVRFKGDGTGQGIRWEFVSDTSRNGRRPHRAV